ncbi:hypothetical protein E1263_40655 [Kribbella antibiotica]|uniref:Uncharacterized protein n=1 Tax=Kribbella antibiotica TaxID=190195 RepID=A0A4R4YHX1_9ACTN|nr:hypothetical protein [Kribbella antibiotica]TDD44478.1 hypothetical protein E1263_40655 [Kribbella antibiotica]
MNERLPAQAASDNKPLHDDIADSLKLPARIACGVVGTVAGAAGGIGSFVPDSNSGGVPVLLAGAALFGYLAISGQRITLLKLGDNEARLSRAFRAAGRALRDPDVPEQTKAEIAEDLEPISSKLPTQTRQSVDQVLTDRDDALNYERAVKGALESMFSEQYTGEMINKREQFDALLQSGDASLVVEIKHLRGNPSRIGKMIVQELAWQLTTVPTFTAGLLITNQPITQRLAELLEQAAPRYRMEAVTWRGAEDDNALRASVSRLLAS